MRRAISWATVIFAVAIIFLLAAHPQKPSALRTTMLPAGYPDLILVQAPILTDDGNAQPIPHSSRIVRLGAGHASELLNLSPEFFAAAYPSLSYDAEKILFSAKGDAEGHWQIWEMHVDGSQKRQITRCRDDCLHAVYLPDGCIAYTVLALSDGHQLSHIAVSNADGSGEHPITFSSGNFEVKAVLRDGRILASARWPLSSQEADSRLLYTLRPDGTALALFRDTTRQPMVVHDADELEDGSIVLLDAGGHSAGTERPVAVIPRGSVQYRALDSSGMICRSLNRLSQGKVIASCSKRPDSTAQRFDLYEFDTAGAVPPKRVFADSRRSTIAALAVLPRKKPAVLWSTLRDDAKAGYFICLNAYRTGDQSGEKRFPKIDQVRVLSQAPGNLAERVLGEAPVEQDGSFYIAIPPDQPIRFELLDAQRHVLKAQQSWIWARPGEQHGCVGCHENQALVGDNHWPMALKRFDTPFQIGVKDNPPLAPE